MKKACATAMNSSAKGARLRRGLLPEAACASVALSPPPVRDTAINNKLLRALLTDRSAWRLASRTHAMRNSLHAPAETGPRSIIIKINLVKQKGLCPGLTLALTHAGSFIRCKVIAGRNIGLLLGFPPLSNLFRSFS